jgi:hypothetical protein
MFELVLFAALSHSIATTPVIPGFDPAAAATDLPASSYAEMAPPAFVEAEGISWRASVEAASAGGLDGDSAFPSAVDADDTRVLELALGDSSTLGGSYDALLAKRWHWFELYGVSRLHVVPKESRHPWWFSY